MTREEAIKIIEVVFQSKEAYKYYDSVTHQALNMAIEALKGEPSDDLISRAEAIEALGEEPPVWCDEEYEIAERDQWRADIEAIKSVPSADRPRGEWKLLAEERPVDDYEIIATVYWPGYGDSTIAVGHIDRFDNWHLYSPTEGELIKGFEVIAWKTLPEPYCGADMRGEDE